MKKSAVEWLVEQILVKFEDHMNEDYEMDFSKPPNVKFYNAFIDSTDLSEYVNKAKQMEKEQIINAWTDGFMSTGEGWNGEIPPECYGQVLDNEEYYNKMFNLK